MGTQFLAVAIGGAVGSVLRFATSIGAVRLLGTGFPYGTLLVNIVGCLSAGFVFGFAEGRTALSPTIRILLLTGFLGGYTTFSTFMLETATLAEGATWGGLAHFFANNAAGATLAVGGLYLGRLT